MIEALSDYTPPGCGFSDVAIFIHESVRRDRHHLRDAHAFGIGRQVYDELSAVGKECRQANWDGYGALPVEQETLHNAFRFLESLPANYPPPSVGAEPDGELTFDWHRSPRRTLSISVSMDGNLHFAGLFGPNRVYGTEVFFGDAPQRILELIQRVYRT